MGRFRSFQNVNKIINTQPIRKGNNTSDLEANHRTFDEFGISTAQGSIDLPSFLSTTETDSIIVIKDGKVVYERYDRTNTEDSIHIMMSMTKSVAGLVAGILVGQGKLDANNRASTYVPEVKGTSYEGVTVRQLLDMRAGIKFDDTDPEYRKAAGWNPLETDEKPTNLHEFISKFEAPPGPKIDGIVDGDPFDYISVNTDLLGWVLERASGKPFAELVSELIWRPMGAQSDAYITLDRAGNARTAGGMCATLRDIARMCLLILDDDNGVVPASWISDILNNGSKEAFQAGPWNTGRDGVFGDVAYRSCCLGSRETQMVMGIGIHGQMMFADRANKIVMVKTSSQPARIDMMKTFITIKAFQEFRRILMNMEKEGR